MAKTATEGTLSPRRLGVGGVILAGDTKTVIEAMNLTAAESHRVHVSLISGPPNWDGGAEPAGQGVEFNTSSGYRTEYTWKIYVSEDTQRVLVGALCAFSGSNEGHVRFTVGSTNTVLNFTSATTTEQTDTLLTSATGTGELTCTLETDHDVGTDSGQELVSWRVQSQILTAGVLPDPVLE